LREQRLAESAAGLIDGSHRDVVIVPGPDRLEWLHAICSQHVADLAEGDSTESLVLSPNGHVEQHWVLTEFAGGVSGEPGDAADGTVWIDTEPGAADEVLNYLLKMRFLKRVEPAIVTADFAVLSVVGPQASAVLEAAQLPVPDDTAVALPDKGFVRRRPRGGGFDLLIDRAQLGQLAAQLRDAGATPLGSWGAAALRVARRLPRFGLDTDHRTIAHEVGWIGPAVHLDKGAGSSCFTCRATRKSCRHPVPRWSETAERWASSVRRSITTSWARSPWPWSSGR
jgi:folate-binding Fe-S cluster repair protein YgfZ